MPDTPQNPADAFPPLSDAELDALEADVSTPAAKESAQRAFRRHAPKAQKPQLDATDFDQEQ